MIKKLAAILLATALFAALPAYADSVPYLLAIDNPEQPIFAGPSYFTDYAGVVGEAGTYTIVEETVDEFGAPWGRLKSGAGWVCLNDVRADEYDDVIVAALPYVQQVENADTPVFSGPGYDHFMVQTVHEAGVYTIVEEMPDGEGALWGRLQSGAGWIDLTSVLAWNAAPTPVTAALADDQLLPADCYRYVAEENDGTVLLLFHAHEALTNVRVESLTPNGVAYMPEQTLYTLPLLTPEKPLVIGVVYYGDMTAYGLSFTDATGTERHFAADMSGRNGMLLLEEYYIN